MNKIAIVTGANSGLGFETTLAFSKEGIHTIMACRNLKKAESAKNKILGIVPNASLDIIALDLNSFDSVRAFASLFIKKYDSLNLLVNNAGFMATHFELTKDGNESQFQANFLGHFLLTGLLLTTLNKTKNARIISLASIAHRFGTFSINKIKNNKPYFGFKVYSNTKIACLIFSALLQKKLKSTNQETISIAAHPGISITNISNKLNPTILKLQDKLGKLFMSNQKQGAESIVFAALNKNVKGGEYYGPSGIFEIKGKPKKVNRSRLAKKEKLAFELWNYAESVTGISY